MPSRIQLRRDISTVWASVNPVLADGEIGIEKDTMKYKLGDGITAWNLLSYKGLDGAQGIQGIQGDPGIQGIQGVPGTAGVWGSVSGTLENQTDLNNALNGKAQSTHAHAETDVTNLVTDLNSKAASVHTHAYEPADVNIQAHVSSAHAPSNAQKNSDIIQAEIEAKLTGAISTHSHAGGGGGQPVGLVVLANDTLAQALATNTNTKLTVTAARTLTTTVPAAGTRCAVIVLTSGATSFTITFGTGFKPVGTLATGTTTSRVFVVNFISDGTNLYEAGRTAAMVA